MRSLAHPRRTRLRPSEHDRARVAVKVRRTTTPKPRRTAKLGARRTATPGTSALFVCALLGVTLAGCGKSLPSERQGHGGGVTKVSTSGGSPEALAASGVATKNTTRLGGADAVADAAAVALAVYPGLTPATRPAAAVLVDDRDWPVALAASVLAAEPLNAPLLYAEGNTLPAISAEALHALHPRGMRTLQGAQVIEIGTTAAPTTYRSHVVQATATAATGALASGATQTSAATRPGPPTGSSSTSATSGPRDASQGTSAAGSGAAGSGTTAAADLSAVNAAATAAARIEGIIALARGAAPRHVIVVGADGPAALAMPAAGLAAETGAPILPVAAVGIPRATRRVLIQLGHPTIYVVGPPSAVSEATLTRLSRYGTVRRISAESVTSLEAGSNSAPSGGAAVMNSIAVARYVDGSFGWGVEEPGHGLVFANATRPLDAPAAAPLSANGDFGPLLLLESPSGVPEALARYLADIQPSYPEYAPTRGFYNHGWLIGDEAAIAAGTQAELDAMLETVPRNGREQ